jgi:hypothetical protein
MKIVRLQRPTTLRLQSQRDCILQPGVASRELLWEKRPVTVNPNGVAATCVGTVATTPLGLLPNFVAIPG